LDLQLYARVLWRHRLLLAAGLAVALGLAILSVVRVEFAGATPKFVYRQPEIWQANTRLMLTQRGFPMGRSGFPASDADSGVFADPGRMSSLASFYAQLASADEVQLKVLAGTTKAAALTATPVRDPNTEDPSPFVDILGLSETPLSAARISYRGAVVFMQYVARRQQAARIPERDRVLLQVVKQPIGIEGPVRIEGRKKTTPAFVFLAVLVATVGLIFVVENARGRRAPTSVEAEPDPEVQIPRRKTTKAAASRSA
jgi:hypothetical protein